MAKFPVVEDILEQILLKLDVEDLIRCKSVCKSWLTLISHLHFIKTHLNYSYNADLNKNPYGRRWVCMTLEPPLYLSSVKDLNPVYHVIGSSNGLVCISYRDSVITVANSCTRVQRTLPWIPGASSYWEFCCGFGYDSSTDDYKLVVGLQKGEYETNFIMLTLKSNVWKAIGEVKCGFNRRVGTLYNGALHWLMFSQNHHTSNVNSNNNSNINNNSNKKEVILSFDLPDHVFKEMSPPDDDDDPLYQSMFKRRITLGVMGECLSISRPARLFTHHNMWIMNKYNVKESWGMIGQHDCGKGHQPQHQLRSLEYTDRMNGLLKGHFMIIDMNCFELEAPVFVRSLVSPHAPFLN